jgi:hypothetical protein
MRLTQKFSESVKTGKFLLKKLSKLPDVLMMPRNQDEDSFSRVRVFLQETNFTAAETVTSRKEIT